LLPNARSAIAIRGEHRHAVAVRFVIGCIAGAGLAASAFESAIATALRAHGLAPSMEGEPFPAVRVAIAEYPSGPWAFVRDQREQPLAVAEIAAHVARSKTQRMQVHVVDASMVVSRHVAAIVFRHAAAIVTSRKVTRASELALTPEDLETTIAVDPDESPDQLSALLEVHTFAFVEQRIVRSAAIAPAAMSFWDVQQSTSAT
jgi:hypothetical protein